MLQLQSYVCANLVEQQTEVIGVQTLFWPLGMFPYESVHLPPLKMQYLHACWQMSPSSLLMGKGKKA